MLVLGSIRSALGRIVFLYPMVQWLLINVETAAGLFVGLLLLLAIDCKQGW